MRFTVGKKIGLGFGIVVVLLLTIFGITLSVVSDASETLNKSIHSNEIYVEVGQPTVDELNELKENILNAQTYINDWAIRQSRDDEPNKVALNKLTDTIVPQNLRRLEDLAKRWDSTKTQDLDLFFDLVSKIHNLFAKYDEGVRSILIDFESYADPSNLFIAQFALEDEIEPATQEVLSELEDLIQRKNNDATVQKEEMSKSFQKTNANFSILFWGLLLAGLVLAVGTLVIATFTTLSITRPVQELKSILVGLGKGVFPRKEIQPSNDEIGEMSIAMNNLVDGLKRTTDFANEVGKSHFDYPYEPLSDEDTLGHALLKMRDELAENERILEQKVIERTKEVVRQKEEIERQSEKLEELYKDVTDSIRYAKRLQDSILPQDNYIHRILPESFVLFKPKDIVSGDFYWFSETKDKLVFTAVDCTGHGVPGAFMSLIGANALNQIVNVNHKDEAGIILDELNKLSSEALNKSEEGSLNVRDGMDVALCSLHKDKNVLEYAGANNPLYLVRGEELTQIKADKFAIASFEDGTQNYTTHKIDVQSGDVVYIFSDGYADQFGGDKGKKFMYKKFRELLMSIKDLAMPEQKKILDNQIEEWKGTFEQVDDILVIGVKIN